MLRRRWTLGQRATRKKQIPHTTREEREFGMTTVESTNRKSGSLGFARDDNLIRRLIVPRWGAAVLRPYREEN